MSRNNVEKKRESSRFDLKKHDEAKRRAEYKAAFKVYEDLSKGKMQFSDVKKFRLSIYAVGKEMLKFLEDRHLRYKDLASLLLEGYDALGHDFVAVTQPFLGKEGEEKQGEEKQDEDEDEQNRKLGSFH